MQIRGVELVIRDEIVGVLRLSAQLSSENGCPSSLLENMAMAFAGHSLRSSQSLLQSGNMAPSKQSTSMDIDSDSDISIDLEETTKGKGKGKGKSDKRKKDKGKPKPKDTVSLHPEIIFYPEYSPS